MKDQYDDKSRIILKKISNVIDLPDFVKQASEESDENLTKLASRCFADTRNRKFPIHTKDEAFLSQLYFTKNASLYVDENLKEEVMDKLAEASNLWDLPNIVIKPMKKEAALEKLAEIPIRNNQGTTIDTIILNSPRDFEKAAIQLFENKEGFPYNIRKDISRGLLSNKIANISPEIETYLEKAAGLGVGSTSNTLNVLKHRASMYENRKQPEFADQLCKLAEEVIASPSSTKLLSKVANIIDIMDHSTGINNIYDDDIKRPEEELFVMTHKIASEIKENVVKLQNGTILEKEAIQEDVLDNFLEDIIGSSINKISKEEKIDMLVSLPAPDADDFDSFRGTSE